MQNSVLRRILAPKAFPSTYRSLPTTRDSVVAKLGKREIVSRPAAAILFAKVSQIFRSMVSATEGFKVSQAEKWWPDDSVAIVTGANKGIGKAAAQILAHNGIKTIVAARDEGRGKEAVEDLKKVTGSSNIFFEQLDISNPGSVKKFASRIGDNHKNVTFLCNNAGIAYKGNIFGAEEARKTLDTNFVGTKDVCEAIAPLMREGGRIVNVCSLAGKERIIKSPKLLGKFQDAKNPKDIAALADDFVDAVEEASTSDRGMRDGWPGSMYGVSKLCEATYTRLLAKQYQSKLDVNACCPGYVSTDMSSHRGYKTVLQGADTPVWLLLLAPKGSSGKFFSDRKEESF